MFGDVLLCQILQGFPGFAKSGFCGGRLTTGQFKHGQIQVQQIFFGAKSFLCILQLIQRRFCVSRGPCIERGFMCFLPCLAACEQNSEQWCSEQS